MNRFQHGFPDKTQGPIVRALRSVPGVTVKITNKVGDGFPDLTVGFRGVTYLIETKTPDRIRKHGGKFERANGGLNEAEARWHATWTGGPHPVVGTPAEALAAIGVLSLADVKRGHTPAECDDPTCRAHWKDGFPKVARP